MSGAGTKSAFEAIRALTLQMDQTVESLLDAHGFALAAMTAGVDGAEAHFADRPAADDLAWQLILTQPLSGPAEVRLTRGTAVPASVSLAIRLGDEGVKSMAAGLGLALSLTTVAQSFGGG